MPTKAELESALINADKAGDAEAAKQLANALKAGNYDEQQPQLVTGQSEFEPIPERPIDRMRLAGETGLDVTQQMLSGAYENLADAVDFLGPDTVNALLQIIGTDKRMPTAKDAARRIGLTGQAMQEGTLSEVVDAVGGTLPAAASLAPAAGRNLLTAGGQALELLGVGSAAPLARALPVGAQAAETALKALPTGQAQKEALPSLIAKSGDAAAAGYKLDDIGQVVKDPIQKKVMKTGLSEGMTAMLAAANKSTKRRALKMIEATEDAYKNIKNVQTNSPQKVVGGAIKDRLDVVLKANKEAGEAIDTVARGLKNKPVDVSPAIERFVEDLAREDIAVNLSTGKLDFSDSTIQGLSDLEGLLQKTFTRLYDTKDPTKDAYKAHIAKRFIDRQVSYGKSQTGLDAAMEGILKRLRSGIDNALDTAYPAYDEVNTSYKETIDAIENIQKLAGQRYDLSGDNMDSVLGRLSRRILSNAATSDFVEGSFKQLQDVSKKYGDPVKYDLDSDIGELVQLESTLGAMFPEIIKSKTFQAEVGKGVLAGRAGDIAGVASGGKSSAVRFADEVAGKVLDKLFSKTEKQIREERIEALKELLSQ